MDEQMNQNQEEIIETSNQMYLDEIANLKRNSVSREKYDQLMQENKNLLTTLVNGEQVSAETEPSIRPIEEIKKDLMKEQTNLDYCKHALELRDAVIKTTGDDPFVGRGHNLNPTQEDYNTANRVATVMQECIDYANGDSEVFTNELMRRTNDVNLPRRR